MRYREIVNSSLADVTVDTVLARLMKAEKDIANSKLLEELKRLKGRPDEAFLEMLAGQISKAKRGLEFWLEKPTPLYRGMSRPPKGSAGVHWTTALRAAKQHGVYLMRMRPCPNFVDWDGTVIRRISWEFEMEIKLIPKSPLVIARLAKDGVVLASNLKLRA